MEVRGNAGIERGDSNTLKWVRLVALAFGIVGAGCRADEPAPMAPPDPLNELPFGHVDTPAEGAEVNLVAFVAGWAMDDVGIREVRVFVDGRFGGRTPLNTPRPDVAKAFLNYARDTELHGWGFNVDLRSRGKHVILAQAVDTAGATRDIGTVSVTVR